jgi:hypothetical protein
MYFFNNEIPYTSIKIFRNTFKNNLSLNIRNSIQLLSIIFYGLIKIVSNFDFDPEIFIDKIFKKNILPQNFMLGII